MSSSHTFPDNDGSSFFDYLLQHRPDLMPANRDWHGEASPLLEPNGPHRIPSPPHGTTVLAIKYGNGVVIAGDRRATEGFQIAGRQMEKVFKIDGYSAMAIAGTAGPAVEMVKLFQTELEHYEKIEGTQLSLEGKANRLGAMIRGNLPMALQGLAVVPLFAGFDTSAGVGRLFSYDVTGGRYEEHEHHTVGSGSVFARGALKKLWRPNLTAAEALSVADDDSATGGPDTVRQLWPVVFTVDSTGARRVPDAELAAASRNVIEARTIAGREA